MSSSHPAGGQATPRTPSDIRPASPGAKQRRLSQSAASEDSQTVMIHTPSSLEPSRHESPKREDTQLPANDNDPRKCWICFSDETEDTPTSSKWVSPCPCALQAHQSCLLDWIADLQSPKRKKAKKVQCPQCKSDIAVIQPHSLAIELARACQRISGKLIWPSAGASVAMTIVAGLTLHGFATMRILLGGHGYNKFVYSAKDSTRVLLMPMIPIILVVSRTKAGDNVLPLLPLLYLALPKTHRKVGYPWGPWGLTETFLSLPMLRSLYFGAYRRFALPYEKAWMQEIQPRASENMEDSGEQPDQENGEEEGQDNGPLDMDFELGVQIEVEAVEEVGDHEHDHHQHPLNDEQPQDIPQVGNIDPINDNPVPNADNQNEGRNHDAAAAPPPQARPPQQPRQPIIQSFFFAIPGFTRMSMGALAFPLVSYYMGEILKATLPTTWISTPRRWGRRSESILQTRIGRTLVGGCLFVVLKDALFLYSKFSMAQNHKKRKVLNYNEITTPWYQKSIDELIARK